MIKVPEEQSLAQQQRTAAKSGGFNWSTQHFNLFWKDGVNIMKYRRRVFFTDKQKS
ncbi:MAG: hypothetical protein ACI9HB_003198, partial [Gammaproteobacteria bacterium]